MKENRIAIVTGGSKGIGRAIASSLVRAGARVAITGRNEKDLAKATSQLNQEGKAAGYVCDVRDYEQVKSTIARVAAELGGVDILVNNAGVGIFATVESMSVEDFRTVLETNVFGVFYCCHEAIPLMKRRGGGYIINISSLAGANAHPQLAAYNASKFGLNGFSEALMQEVRHDGIKVSYIMPGSVNTKFGGDEPSDAKSWQLQAQDVAQVVMDLLEYPDRALPSRVEIRPSRPPKDEDSHKRQKCYLCAFCGLIALIVMRAVVQRVTKARVTVGDEIAGEIENGLVVLLGIARDDTRDDADYLVPKIIALRIFDDAEGRMNVSVKDIGGALLVVSQFTLYGDVRRGLRPSWSDAAAPEIAEPLYDYFVESGRKLLAKVETGSFRKMMQIELVNDGPVTILLDSRRTF